MNKLVEKWSLPNSPSQQLYVYSKASVNANLAMQEPLERLYQYENQPDMNQPDMREKVKEYIGELDKEIKRVESEIVNTDDKDYEARMMSRIYALTEVRSDLLSRLEEVV